MHQPHGEAMEIDAKTVVPFAARSCLQEHDQNHQCTRFCKFHHAFGNVYFCETSRQSHVCDNNCTNRIYYDSETTICRLSKKLFPVKPAPSACRKRVAHLDMELMAGKKHRR